MSQETCQFLHTLACPTMEDLKKIIKMNSYQIVLLLLKISSSQKQYMGLFVTTWRFKQKLSSGNTWWTYCFFNGLPFIASISKLILYRAYTRLVDRTIKHYRSAKEEIFKYMSPLDLQLHKSMQIKNSHQSFYSYKKMAKWLLSTSKFT